MKKLIYTLLLLGFIVAAWFAWQRVVGEGEASPGGPRTVATVETRTLRDVIESSGTVDPLNTTDVRSEVSGRIQKIHVEDGDRVERGDVLVELDRITPEAELREAERNYEAEVLREQRAQRDFERLKDLFDRDFAREREFLDAKTDWELSKIQVQVREAQVERARETLAQTTIRAPMTGMVVDLNVNEGQVITGATSVNEGTRLMSIHDLDILLVRLNVNELDIDRVRLNDETAITFDSLPGERILGKVREVSPFARMENNLPVFRVSAEFDPGDLFIRPGISARIRIVVEEREDVLAVPLAAVFRDRRERFLMVRDENGDFSRRIVQTGLNDMSWVEITEGVREGDEISLVRPGTRPQGRR